MKQVQSNFVFSVFKYNSIANFKSQILSIFGEKIDKKMAFITEGEFNINDYIDSFSGNSHRDIFSFWKTSNYPHYVFFTSNSGDGRFTLCNVIHQRLKCEYLQCTLRNGNKQIAPAYYFHYANESLEERDILVYKDSKWIFYEKGIHLPFENSDLYKRHIIKQRLNYDIILSYLQKYGIVFEDIDSNITDSFTYVDQGMVR